MSADKLVALIVEKWQVRPEPKWIPHSERQVPAKITAKRIVCQWMTFDRATGRQIGRGTTWFRYSVREVANERR